MNDLDITGLKVRTHTIHYPAAMITKRMMTIIERVDVPNRPEWDAVRSMLDWYEYANASYAVLGDTAWNGETYSPTSTYSSAEAVRLTAEAAKPQIEARLKRAKQEEEAARKLEKEAVKSKEYQSLLEQQRKENQDRNERSDTPIGHARRIRELEATVARLQRDVADMEKRLEQKIRDAYLVGAP